ncbi:MAG: carbohydrate ABC transporter permease [Ruminococcaceae bacterium]|nr:carbohydrate ABC transporter permease [Oscillospiraceae bacterium]
MESKWFRRIGSAVLLISVIITAFPFWVMFSVSLQTMQEIYSHELNLWPSFQWGNYAEAMTNGPWGRYILNSLYVTAGSTLISLFINAMTGYVFARMQFPWKRTLLVLVLIGMMIPTQVTLVPLFILVKNLPLVGGNNILGMGGTGLVDTYAGLMLPFIAGSFGVFMCRQFYIMFPKELDEAAKIDGCSRFGTFCRIYLPLSKALLASLGVLKFIGAWNEYTWPLVITNTGSGRITTVQLALTAFRNEGEIFWNLMMAATLVSTGIVLVVFVCLQKYFVAGILAGSVKE